MGSLQPLEERKIAGEKGVKERIVKENARPSNQSKNSPGIHQ